MIPLRSESEFAALLEPTLGGRVRVRFSRSRRTVARAERGDGTTLVVVHNFFSDAPDTVCRRLAEWLSSGRAPNPWLGGWVDLRLARIDRDSRESFRADHQSDVHPIVDIYDELMDCEFGGTFDSEELPIVTWGRRGRTRASRTIRLGSFERERRIVRLHPVLDQPAVPRWVVSFVMYHELLHAALLEDVLARADPHGAEFATRERGHPDYWRANLWLSWNLPALVHSSRTGEPIDPRGRKARQLEMFA